MLDPLAEVLRSVRLAGGFFLDARFTAPWCVLSQITPDDCRPFLAAPSLVIAYHVVIEGRFSLGIAGEPPVEVSAGEVVLVPRNDPHTLASGPGVPPINGHALIQPAADGGLARAVHGGGGAPTHLVCGFLGSEDRYNPLIASLPRALKLDVRQGTRREWVEASVQFAAEELARGRVASPGIMSRLSELLFIEAVRGYAASLGERQSGWLRGLGDPKIGRALAMIHGDLAAPWSAAGLAKAVALSRSAFVQRFTKLVGLPPIRYLTLARLQAARLHLRESRRPLAELAHLVGYESEEAFSRAFKREFGLAPAHWRDQQAAG